ncbi:MAG: aspartate aminotransferase family protein, partial [Methylotenera sp.]|nr:aspartate aminotransferase family protein [Oligoflexia bacterium]
MSENQVSLPKKGTARDTILEKLQSFRDKDANWHDGRTWSLVYHAGDEHTEFLKKAYCVFFHENALNPGAFPSLKKFEAEVVSMAANLFNGGETAAGTMTSGGSESIMMAVKTYRDQARALRPEITRPEMIVPITIHPAFNKAAQYFDVKAVHVAVGDDFRADLKAVEAAITPNTILIVGSAPAYPHGVVDPITEMAALALKHRIGCHVDACVGGFLLPFLKKLGRPIPAFDFSLPGVTSITADLHKYGFTAKGASVVLYRDKELRRFQFFTHTEWPGGLFASPSMTGTRPGGSIAAAWATLNAMGEDGYLEMAEKVMNTTETLQKGLQTLGLKILGKPEMSVFAF